MKKLPRSAHKWIIKYDCDGTNLKDILRASWIFENGDDLQKGLEGLIRVAGNLDNGWAKIIEIKNNWVGYAEDYHGEYVDVKAIIMFKSKSLPSDWKSAVDGNGKRCYRQYNLNRDGTRDLTVILQETDVRPGVYLFYEIQFLTKAQAALKGTFHGPYSVLRTIFGDRDDFNKILRKSMKRLNELKINPVGRLRATIRRSSAKLIALAALTKGSSAPDSPSWSTTASDDRDPDHGSAGSPGSLSPSFSSLVSSLDSLGTTPTDSTSPTVSKSLSTESLRSLTDSQSSRRSSTDSDSPMPT